MPGQCKVAEIGRGFERYGLITSTNGNSRRYNQRGSQMPLCKGKLRLVCFGAVLLIVLEFFATVALGQDSSSSRIADLRAVVSDTSGARIASAEIAFKGEKTVTVNTGEDGSIRVQIPFGRYAVTISRPGFETAKIPGFAIQAAKPSDLEVVLQVSHCCDEPGIGGVEPQIITSDLPNRIEQRPRTTPPRATHTVDPKYSAGALRVAKDKVILVTVTVPPDGIPTNLRIARGVRPDVDKAVIDAVQKWRFEPATRDGKPIEATITVQVDFHITR
jgi:TonB family protein